MSGFDSGWLALRESADHQARPAASAQALASLIRHGRPLRVLDLGCGTGSNLRWLAPRLGGHQQWQCLDDDAELLAALPRRVMAWADATAVEVQRHGRRVRVLSRDGGEWLVATRRVDIAAADLSIAVAGSDLVTASALADLVSQAWLQKLSDACARARAGLLLALDYDGRIALDPIHPGDAELGALVNRHQRSDKGFGPALGPEATAVARRLLEERGHAVQVMTSDWRLHATTDGALLQQLVDGWVDAALQIRPSERASLEAWRRQRLSQLRAGRLAATVGHADLVALPG